MEEGGGGGRREVAACRGKSRMGIAESRTAASSFVGRCLGVIGPYSWQQLVAKPQIGSGCRRRSLYQGVGLKYDESQA